MKLAPVDLTNFDKTIESIEGMHRHRQESPIDKSDELYYELVLQYFRELRTAKEEGKIIVGHIATIPIEILHAMDLVHFMCIVPSVSIALTQHLHQDILAAANELGLPAEICSAHRVSIGGLVRGYFPRPDIVAGSSYYCDCMVQNTELLANLADCPFFVLERPYQYTEEGVRYFTRELEDFIHFLEEKTQRKMDWDRLKEVTEQVRRLLELRREIAELRKAVPSPMRNKHQCHLEVIDFYFAGRPEAVTFYECVRDELKERIEQKKGFVPQERYRLLNFFLPPTHSWKILDWWERAHGAVSVMEPLFSYTPRQVEIDPEKPLESIARKCFWGVYCSYFYCPGKTFAEDTVALARDYRADGAVWYVHIGCRHSSALIRMMKDALREEVDVPLLVVDADYVDPTFAPEEVLRDRTEAFFEMLEDLKT